VSRIELKRSSGTRGAVEVGVEVVCDVVVGVDVAVDVVGAFDGVEQPASATAPAVAAAAKRMPAPGTRFERSLVPNMRPPLLTRKVYERFAKSSCATTMFETILLITDE
jgi:hypothetical protein